MCGESCFGKKYKAESDLSALISGRPTFSSGQTYVEPGRQSGSGSRLPLIPRLALVFMGTGYVTDEHGKARRCTCDVPLNSSVCRKAPRAKGKAGSPRTQKSRRFPTSCA